MSFFKLKEGKNCLRILPFRHTFNKFDLAAGRCEEEHVDQTIDLMFLDVTRPFGKGVINCLEDDELCPIWQEYYDTPKEDKKGNKPKPQYFVNLIDLDEPNKGVQVVGLSPSVFMGERSTVGERKGLGIYDYYDGYDPKDEDQHEEAEADPDQAEGEGGGGAAKFKKIKAIGDALLGLDGRDVLVYTYKKGKTIRLDHGQEKGAVIIRPKAKCDKLASKWNKSVQDLYMLEWLFPGYASSGKHLNALAGDFIEWREAQKEGKDVEPDPDQDQTADPDQNGDPDQQPDKPKKKKSKKAPKKPKKPKKKKDPEAIDRGSKVRCTDKMNDDNTMTLPEEDWTEFIGIFERYDKQDGKTVGFAHLDPEDQEDDDLKEYLEQIQEDADTSKGGPFYAFPVDCIVPY